MPTVADVYRALNAMQEEGIVEKYAVGGGMAALFYAETTRTYDIDIFVLIEQQGLLVDLSRIYNWSRGQGHGVEQEYLMIYGVPVQILVAGEGLESEAVQTSQMLDYDGVPVPVIRPEFLILLYLRAGSAKRRVRAADLVETGVDIEQVTRLAKHYNLQKEWEAISSDAP